MKKFNECNACEKKAWKNIKNAAADYIFGMQNGCFDNEVGSQAYNDYKKELEDLETLINVVYHEAITSVYNEGSIYFGKGAESAIRDIRFCGKEFLLEVTEHFCRKYQAEALAEI